MNYFSYLMIAIGIGFSTIPTAILLMVINKQEYAPWIVITLSCISLALMIGPLFERNKDQNSKTPITSGESSWESLDLTHTIIKNLTAKSAEITLLD